MPHVSQTHEEPAAISSPRAHAWGRVLDKSGSTRAVSMSLSGEGRGRSTAVGHRHVEEAGGRLVTRLGLRRLWASWEGGEGLGAAAPAFDPPLDDRGESALCT